MTRYATVAALAVVCFVSGCAHYYYQEGKTLEECRQDAQACYADFKKYQAVENEEALGRFNIDYDYERDFLNTCMKDKGYSIVAENKLPLKVKRVDPDRWSKKHHGLAGLPD